MYSFNLVTSAIFDVLLAPLGHRLAAFDLLIWPVLAGVVALLVYKRVSNQAGIARAKNSIAVHLLEVLLYKDNLVSVLVSTARVLVQNALYVGHNILPMIVMFGPMTVILVQLVANYGYAPHARGDTELLSVKLDRSVTQTATREVKLELPPGLELAVPAVRTEDEVVWKLRMVGEGEHVVGVVVDGERFEKRVVVGGEPAKMPVLRTKSWEAILYPGEAAMPSDAPVEELRMAARTRELDGFPDGEGGVLLWFFGASLAAGFLLKDWFGVTL